MAAVAAGVAGAAAAATVVAAVALLAAAVVAAVEAAHTCIPEAHRPELVEAVRLQGVLPPCELGMS